MHYFSLLMCSKKNISYKVNYLLLMIIKWKKFTNKNNYSDNNNINGYYCNNVYNNDAIMLMIVWEIHFINLFYNIF